MLSVKVEGNDEIQHFKIQKREADESQYLFSLKNADEPKEFVTVPALLRYYKNKSVTRDVTAIGDCLEPELSYAFAAPKLQNDSKYFC